jgi:RecJ-like exonuclease
MNSLNIIAVAPQTTSLFKSKYGASTSIFSASIIIFVFKDKGFIKSLNSISEAGLKDVFIIDHHEIIQEIPEDIYILNSELCGNHAISGSGLTYLFCRQINPEIKDSAKLAIIGMIGDCLEKNIGKMNNHILNDAEIVRKRGLLIYPSTRPLNKVLEFSSEPYIPGVTGNSVGVNELLREIGFNDNGKCKCLIELNEEEM